MGEAILEEEVECKAGAVGEEEGGVVCIEGLDIAVLEVGMASRCGILERGD